MAMRLASSPTSERPAAAARQQQTRPIEKVQSRRRAVLRVLALVTLLFALAALVYGDHVQRGGWVGDAWVTRAWYVLYPHDAFLSTVGHFLDLDSMASRPANAVYRVTLNGWFGPDTAAWLVWQLVSCVAMCVAVYALLRAVGLGYLDALAIAALLVVFPASTALWLWSPVVHASLAISLASLGFLLARSAFRADGARRLSLHLASLAAFVLSVLLYEVCLPLFLASLLLYAFWAPRAVAVRRWLVDCCVLLPIALVVSGSTEARDQGLADSIGHAADMSAQLPRFLFDVLLPFGSAQVVALLCLAAIYLWGYVELRRAVIGGAISVRLRRLFAIAVAGGVVILLGYLIYVPGLDYYMPLARGIADRINAVAAIGWVLFLYASIALTATLATRRLREASLYAGLVTAVLAVGLGLSWLDRISEESSAYVAATEEGDRVLDVIERAVPEPKRGAAIWAFGQPVEVSPGVPVFANHWNMSAAVALTYRDRRVRGFVAFPGTSFACRPEGIVPGGHGEYTPPPPGTLGQFGSRYGRTYFVDTVRGQFATVTSRRQCLDLQYAFPRSPQLPPG